MRNYQGIIGWKQNKDQIKYKQIVLFLTICFTILSVTILGITLTFLN